MTSPSIKPYCVCVRGRQDGFSKGQDGYWVHSVCRKPVKFVYEHIVLPRMLAGGESFDEIIRRKRVFVERVADRAEQELLMISQELSVDLRLVRKIWDEHD